MAYPIRIALNTLLGCSRKMKNKVEENKMVYIPAGTFVMGTSDEQISRLSQLDQLAKKWMEKNYFEREKPQHKVTLASYSISKFPVTVGEYRLFIEASAYQEKRYWTESGWLWKKSTRRIQPEYWDDQKWTWNNKLPVIGVSWYEANAYCHWLSEKEGKIIRLPTEAEWEKAARGTEGRIYPWGDEFEIKLCNTKASNINKTILVDEFNLESESPYGCVDMAGNASEWTLSEYKLYPYDDRDGRNDTEGEKLRVTRGGSWFKPKIRARVSSRGMNDPFFSDNDVGFRYVWEE